LDKTVKSKCPFKLTKAPYDGGSECDRECVWLVAVPCGGSEAITVCAMVLVGDVTELPRKALNPLEVDGDAK